MDLFGLPSAVASLLVHVIGIGALFIAGYWLVFRPTARLIERARRSFDESTERVRLAEEYVRRFDDERRAAVEEARKVLSGGVKESAAAFDRMRAATTDMVRQEVRSIVQAGMAELRAAKEAYKEKTPV